MPKVRIKHQAIGSVFICKEFVFFKMVVHIIFVVKRVVTKDLEPMLQMNWIKQVTA